MGSCSWDAASWLALTRTCQLLASVSGAAVHSYVMAGTVMASVPLHQNMLALELMVCIVVIYSLLALIIQHSGGRSKRPGCLVNFLVWDILLCIVNLGTVTILAGAGLPLTCDSLSSISGVDSYYGHADGIAVMAISSWENRYCKLERISYFMAAFVLFTFMGTVVFGALRVRSGTYMTKAEHERILATMDHLYELESQKSPKTTSTPSLPPRPVSPVAPSEGIVTRHSSFRESRPASNPAPRNAVPISRRPIVANYVSPSTASGHVTVSGLGVSLVDVPEEDPAAAALVTDGIRHQPSQPSLIPPSPTQDSVEAALISDGMRPQGRQPLSTLPPYSPSESSSNRMRGHANENNEIRLSEYVKGGTRAQNMKDSGRY